jgi:outer membrane protein TolC
MWLWRWGVSASQSIFQGFRKKTAVERATVRLKTASSDLDDAVQALQLSLELAIAERDNAAKARETAESSLFEARKNFEIVKKQYEVGDVSRVEFSDSLSLLTLALGNRVSAFYAAQRAEAKLFALVGRLPVYDERILEEDK